jgi:hypothetical protein
VKELRSSLLGQQIAENDGVLLLSNFIETPEYRSIIETKDSTVVVGRRGTGKSAMFAKLRDFWGEQKHSDVIAIAPEDFQTIQFRSVFSNFDGKYSHIRAVSKIAWKYGLLIEMLSLLSRKFRTRDQMGDHRKVEAQIKHWQQSANEFLVKLSARLLPIVKRQGAESEVIIGGLHSMLEIREVEDAFDALLRQSQNRFYVLIDRLDEGYENDEIGAAIVSGAIAASAELNKRFESVRCVIFQRDNILRAVQKFDPDYTRNIEGEVTSIHWDTHQLQNLVGKRLNVAFDIGLENAQRIWDRCTADEGFGRELQGIGGFKKCLQFTLYRPRDLLALLNQAFYNAGRENRDVIVLKDLEKTAKAISGSRLDDLKKEYSSVFPSLSAAVSIFDGLSPEMTFGEATSVLDSLPLEISKLTQQALAEQDYAILKSEGVLRALYSVGFIGTHDAHSSTFTFCHDGRQPDREFSPSDQVLIHPCYWIALNLSRNALSAEEAAEINDEYEIRVTSKSPEVRKHRLGSLIASLALIKEGREDAEGFENWALTTLQTVFAGHLSNVEAKPNGTSVQRRDIVGTNLAKSSVWRRIEADYGVRQVVFEVKNFKGASRDEYRQMATYLNGVYGRLGFLITRDDDENLHVGSELDWVREIYHSEKKLIVRLTNKFFERMLSKLRSPEKHDAVDSALATILDRYERRYLSNPSSKSASQKISR